MNDCICPKCGSDDWDWANIGFGNALVCTDCGHIYASTGDMEREARKREQSDRWPFPCAEKPLKPLTDKEVKKYNKAKVQSLGDALL